MVRNTHLHKGFYICDREFTEGCCVSYKKKVLCKSPFFFAVWVLHSSSGAIHSGARAIIKASEMLYSCYECFQVYTVDAPSNYMENAGGEHARRGASRLAVL